MKKIIFTLILVLGAGFSAWHFFMKPETTSSSGFTFTEVQRGDLENIISSTGTIEAVNTVEVGTQVSGIIQRIYLDFNDKVRKGQVIAVLDTATLSLRVRTAEASLLRAQAQHEQNLSEYNRNKPLFEKGFISEKEFIPIKTNLEVSRASLETAEVEVERARTDLGYAEIRSPIDGVIIFRKVEPGQTVASSFTTPTLFIVAEDLSRMRILAKVDESDIGQIREGQEVRFTVQSYLDEKFTGTVSQIRLQPETLQNVVNYTVVVTAPNEKGLLMPGMTATVDFLIERSSNVLNVSNAALRFEPTETMLAAFREQMRKRFESMPDSLRPQMGNRQGRFAGTPGGGTGTPGAGFGGGGGFQAGQMPKDMGRLWYVDENGNVNVKRVRTGITDGLKTEITSREDIQEGMKFISGFSTGEAAGGNSGTGSNGSNSGQRRNFGGPPRLF